MIAIQLTAAQIAHAAWALDAMADCADTEDFEYTSADLPQIADSTIVFPTSNVAVVDDLLYRLEEQLPEMAKHDHDATRCGSFRHGASVAAAKRLADKIRSACGVQS